MRQFVIFAVLTVVVAALVPKLYEKPQFKAAVQAAMAEPEPQQQASGYRTMTLRRGSNGHYEAEAVLDGRRLNFLVDTGASVIALRESDAARLGIHPVPRDYTARVSTANGTAKAAPVEIRRVEVGDITVRDVAALVMPDDALGVNLLGMSFLSRVRFEQKNGRLTLEQ